MTGNSLRARARRAARLPLRATLTVLLAVLGLALAPGVASATTSTAAYGGSYGGGYDGGWNGGYGDGTGYESAADSGATRLTPVLNCVVPGRNGAYQALLGYANPTRTTYYLSGSVNAISPSQYNGSQPKSFSTGSHDGVFSLSITSGTVTWNLNGTRLTITSSAAPTCPRGTTLPATGNGTGIAIALVAAGALGVVLVRRARRTAAVPSPTVGTAA